MLAAVQAFTLRRLLFEPDRSRRQQVEAGGWSEEGSLTSLTPSAEEAESALAAALADVLWQAASSPAAASVTPRGVAVIALPSVGEDAGMLERPLGEVLAQLTVGAVEAHSWEATLATTTARLPGLGFGCAALGAPPPCRLPSHHLTPLTTLTRHGCRLPLLSAPLARS